MKKRKSTRHSKNGKKYSPNGRTAPANKASGRGKKDTRTPELPPVSQNVPRGPLALADQCVGILRAQGSGGYVEPDPGYNTSQYGRILIHEKDLNGAPFDMKVVCRIKNPSAATGTYEGTIVEVLGNPERRDVAITSILRQYGLANDFPEAVEAEAENFPLEPSEEDIERALSSGRRDLRSLTTITIDGEDAKDLDDAISLQKLPRKGFRLFVHIADVSHYVQNGSALDAEASNRGTSVYLVDRVIPMLPPRLSNGLCSLNPSSPRFTMTAAMTVDYNGQVTEGEIFESIIQSDARTSYKEVSDALDNDVFQRGRKKFKPMFLALQELANILRKKRKIRGALDFSFPETHVDLDAEGVPQAVYAYPIYESNHIIEELMILCNEFVAETFQRLKQPFIYRIHDEPDKLKIKDFMHIAKLLGASVNTKSQINTKMLDQLLSSFQGEPFAPALEQLLLRSLAKAKYSPDNVGHFGLSSEAYCHFTSPIRRYPDLYIHRIIKSYLHKQKKERYFLGQVSGIAEHSSQMERNAMEAERATVDQKTAEFMAERIGENYSGIISGIFHAGIFVQLENTIEGMIPFRQMDDYFAFDEQRLEAKGKTSGKTFRIGESVRVTVSSVDVLLRRIDFSLTDAVGGKRKATPYKAKDSLSQGKTKAGKENGTYSQAKGQGRRDMKKRKKG